MFKSMNHRIYIVHHIAYMEIDVKILFSFPLSISAPVRFINHEENIQQPLSWQSFVFIRLPNLILSDLFAKWQAGIFEEITRRQNTTVGTAETVLTNENMDLNEDLNQEATRSLRKTIKTMLEEALQQQRSLASSLTSIIRALPDPMYKDSKSLLCAHSSL